MEPAVSEVVFAAPREHADKVRMRCAHAAAAQEFLASASELQVWGWQGRTLGRRAGECWLRVVTAAANKAGGRLWEGAALADTAVPRLVSRPRLPGLLVWSTGDHAYRGELTEYVAVPPVAVATPVLMGDVSLSEAWWADLRTALETLASVPTDREAVRQRWVDDNFRRYLGIGPIRIRDYTTGHGDLHWANLSGAPLVVLDWENWGRLPVGYDVGLLHAYSLATPATAARIRHEFLPVLGTPAGRAGELVALGQLLQACSQGVHPTLAPLIARRAEQLTGTPVPTP